MRAGLLRNPAIVQEATDSVDGRGGVIATWSEFAETDVDVRPLAGSEGFLAQREHAEVSTRIVARHIEGLRPKMRLLVQREHTILDETLDNSETGIDVASASGFPTSGSYRILIDDELIEVTAGQGTTTWTVTRGMDGNTPATHDDEADVFHLAIYDIQSVVDVGGRRRQVEFLARELV